MNLAEPGCCAFIYSCMHDITCTHLLEEALGFGSPKHRPVGEELFWRICRDFFVKTCSDTQTILPRQQMNLKLGAEFNVADRDLLTMEPGAECEFCGERRADGRPLTGLEPFPPWNYKGQKLQHRHTGHFGVKEADRTLTSK